MDVKAATTLCERCQVLSYDDLTSKEGITLGARADLENASCSLCRLIAQHVGYCARRHHRRGADFFSFGRDYDDPEFEEYQPPKKDEIVRIWAHAEYQFEEQNPKFQRGTGKLTSLVVISGERNRVELAVADDILRHDYFYHSSALGRATSSLGGHFWINDKDHICRSTVRLSAWEGAYGLRVYGVLY